MARDLAGLDLERMTGVAALGWLDAWKRRLGAQDAGTRPGGGPAESGAGESPGPENGGPPGAASRRE